MGLSFRMVSSPSSFSFRFFIYLGLLVDIGRYIMIWNTGSCVHGLKMALHSLYAAKKSPVVLGYFN